jgi:hypothetical protein
LPPPILCLRQVRLRQKELYDDSEKARVWIAS